MQESETAPETFLRWLNIAGINCGFMFERRTAETIDAKMVCVALLERRANGFAWLAAFPPMQHPTPSRHIWREAPTEDDAKVAADRMVLALSCDGFARADAADEVMLAAHDLSHGLICDNGQEIHYPELAEALRKDMAAGAPLPGERELEVLSGGASPDEPEDAEDVERVERLYPITVARIERDL